MSPVWDIVSLVGSQSWTTFARRSIHRAGSLICEIFISWTVPPTGASAALTSEASSSIPLVLFSLTLHLPWNSSVTTFLKR